LYATILRRTTMNDNFTEGIPTEITKENLSEVWKMLSDYNHKDPMNVPPFKPKWFERLMNKFGWYRQTTIYVIDHKKLMGNLWTPGLNIPPEVEPKYRDWRW
jgi:hypothetical protein